MEKEKRGINYVVFLCWNGVPSFKALMEFGALVSEVVIKPAVMFIANIDQLVKHMHNVHSSQPIFHSR